MVVKDFRVYIFSTMNVFRNYNYGILVFWTIWVNKKYLVSEPHVLTLIIKFVIRVLFSNYFNI